MNNTLETLENITWAKRPINTYNDESVPQWQLKCELNVQCIIDIKIIE